MLAPNFILLYVENPTRSAAFYADLLVATPIEASETFAMFKLPSGVMLGLWAKHTVEPVAQWQGSAGELGFALADQDAVRQQLSAWQAKGLPIAQALTQMDFGLTFVALDPDGHRLRVFATA